MQTMDSGRKINQAVGKAVASTGKAVGGALTQAKGAFSNWWSAVTTTTPGIPIVAEEKEIVPGSSAPNTSTKVINSTTVGAPEPSSAVNIGTGTAAGDNIGRQTVWFE